LRFWEWLRKLRKENFDLILSSHNTDNFSLSQALLGRWCKPKVLVGFDWKDSRKFYDIAIKSSPNIHYARAQFDLWKYFYPQAHFEMGRLKIPYQLVDKYRKKWKDGMNFKGILFWLGATGDKVLPSELVMFLDESIPNFTHLPVNYALGSADQSILDKYPPVIRDKAIIWNKPLKETALFFSMFDLFISGDTGPMHLAVASGIPTLTVFLSTNLKQYGYIDHRKHFSVKYDGSAECRARILEYLKKLTRLIEKV